MISIQQQRRKDHHHVSLMWIVVVGNRHCKPLPLYQLKWHPLLRVNSGGCFRPAEESRFHRIASFVQRPGDAWQGSGDAFKTKRLLKVTLLAFWHPTPRSRGSS